MNVLNLINEIKEKNENKNEFAYQVPISEFTDRFPILNEVWTHYKGMCNFGTESKPQTIGLNNIISRVPYLSTLRDEVMFYPDKKKYDQYELTETYGDKNYKSVVVPYNDVWCLKNGKYQHLIQSRSFPKYHWDKTKLNEVKNIRVDQEVIFIISELGSEAVMNEHRRVYFVTRKR